MAKALILTDGKAGHENQSRAFARALGLEAEVRLIAFRSGVTKALSYLADRLGVLTDCVYRAPEKILAEMPEGGYALVIGTGSGTFYAAKVFARQLGVKCGVVLYPRGYRLAGFDCILAPSFDQPGSRANVIAIPANLVAADAAFYAAGTANFRAHYRKTTGRDWVADKPAEAVIIGGPNAHATMSAAWMRQRLEDIFAKRSPDAEMWVTTSRRTPPDVEAVVAKYPWDYRLLYSQDTFNPVPAFVANARKLYVTAESTGMLSEACTFGTAEVEALDCLNPGPHKFRRFVEDLYAGGYLGGNRKIDLSVQFTKSKELLLCH